MITFLCFPRVPTLLGILYLGFGDPIASIIGGQIELPYFRFSNGKSLHGTLAAILVCCYITYLSLGSNLNSHLISREQLWIITVIGGFVGGVSEQFSGVVDDNVMIPFCSGLVLTILFRVLNIDPDSIALWTDLSLLEKI